MRTFTEHAGALRPTRLEVARTTTRPHRQTAGQRRTRLPNRNQGGEQVSPRTFRCCIVGNQGELIVHKIDFVASPGEILAGAFEFGTTFQALIILCSFLRDIAGLPGSPTSGPVEPSLTRCTRSGWSPAWWSLGTRRWRLPALVEGRVLWIGDAQRGPTATRPRAASCRPSIRRRSLIIPSKNAPTMHAPSPAASAAR